MGTIICAVADTPEAEEALRAAARLSRAGRMRLVLVHVEERARNGNSDRVMRHGRQLLDRAVAAQRMGEPLDRRVELGERAAALARVAEEEAASVIVLGSPHHRRWLRRPGTELSDALAATAPCPVLVIPPPARQ